MIPPSRAIEPYARRARESFQQYLALKGLRLTRQRSEVLDFMLSQRGHVSLPRMTRSLVGRGVGRATIFRTIKSLIDCGILSHSNGVDGVSYYEVALDRSHHDHVVCVSCGRIQEVRWPELEILQQKTCAAMGFEPRWHRHEVFGLCKACRRAKG